MVIGTLNQKCCHGDWDTESENVAMVIGTLNQKMFAMVIGTLNQKMLPW